MLVACILPGGRVEVLAVTEREERGVPPVDSAAQMIVAVFDGEERGNAGVAILRQEGVPEQAISVAHRPRAQPEISSDETRTGTGAGAGVAVGGALGGAAGLALGLGALVIPGIGPLLAAGPLAVALGGAGVGATAGGLLGSLVGLGIPEPDARRYEQEVRRGGYFVSVRTDDAGEADRVESLLEASAARAVQRYDPRL
jgi:hypothetical protein